LEIWVGSGSRLAVVRDAPGAGFRRCLARARARLYRDAAIRPGCLGVRPGTLSAGAAVTLATATGSRNLAPGFFASADPEVSFDGQRVLFAGKPRREDPWQIWEAPAGAPGEPRRIAAWPEDSIRPLYLPDDQIVYARKTAQGYQLEVLPLEGGQPLRITYAPGQLSDVRCPARRARTLRGPASSPESSVHDLYTVYPDGSGVEAYRCDHGVSRHAARQLASRDIVFTTGQWIRALHIRARHTSGNVPNSPAGSSPDRWPR
jgi:hypothetical protein